MLKLFANLRLKKSQFISMQLFLKLSLFLILFALISSGISVWFDDKRQNISYQLAESRQQQELFREAYERLWDEFFSLQKSKVALVQYSNIVEIKNNATNRNNLVCIYDHFKASEGDATFVSVLESGKQFLTPKQLTESRLLYLEAESKALIQEAKSGFFTYCSELDYLNAGQALDAATEKIRTLIILSRELKVVLEKRISEQSLALTQNYKSSNIAILIGFLLQLFVFCVLSVVDIQTSIFRRIEK